MRGTHDFTVHRASGRGSSGQLASVGRAHASRVSLIFFFITIPTRGLTTPAIAFPGFPLLALGLSSHLLLPLSSSLSSASSPPPHSRLPCGAIPVSPPSCGGALHCGGGWGVAPGSKQDLIRGGTVAPSSSPELGRIQSVGAKPGERGESARPPRAPSALARGG